MSSKTPIPVSALAEGFAKAARCKRLDLYTILREGLTRDQLTLVAMQFGPRGLADLDTAVGYEPK